MFRRNRANHLINLGGLLVDPLRIISVVPKADGTMINVAMSDSWVASHMVSFAFDEVQALLGR